MSKRLNELPENRILASIAKMQRDIQALKTPQPLGPELMEIHSTGYGVIGPVVVEPSTDGWVIANFVPSNPVLSLWTVLWSLYIDPPSGNPTDSAYKWPEGSSLTPAMVNNNVTGWLDYATSNDSLNIRELYVHVYNRDASAHTIYVQVGAYIPSISPGS